MGCDIHVNVEYRHPVLGYQPVVAGGYFVEPRYELFSALAGVRMEPEESCLIPARGFPCDACFPIFAIAHQLVVADANSQLARLVTDWVLASEVPPGSDVFEAEKELVGMARWIRHPDYHHPSYLSHLETMECLRHFGFDSNSTPPVFLVLTDLLASIDFRFGYPSARLVFWFDN
ncbi:hypothetical protein Psta_3047 [Pirellula staleyi DSM 6068]|uniref:Uncharacterized protein n=1 Tax=Pirellula staleyi (strain ATCC 27377 / DSM 6068 / ICPB 4128) TaxID=530564 RepID=D2R9G1_PIRSD|nr:hypothetical protein [Pirellula staleyi]ADB17711.1 hypothetical protein Psta_3047 [Pirellula staleyi DSM 6068]